MAVVAAAAAAASPAVVVGVAVAVAASFPAEAPPWTGWYPCTAVGVAVVLLQ